MEWHFYGCGRRLSEVGSACACVLRGARVHVFRRGACVLVYVCARVHVHVSLWGCEIGELLFSCPGCRKGRFLNSWLDFGGPCALRGIACACICGGWVWRISSMWVVVCVKIILSQHRAARKDISICLHARLCGGRLCAFCFLM